jgi:hypothetical protein
MIGEMLFLPASRYPQTCYDNLIAALSCLCAALVASLLFAVSAPVDAVCVNDSTDRLVEILPVLPNSLISVPMSELSYLR